MGKIVMFELIIHKTGISHSYSNPENTKN